MRAVTIVDNHIEVRDHPDAEPAKGELLVRVRAAGLNRADLMQVQGLYPSPPGSPPDIPGMELAGEVVATGPGVTAFDAGDSVMALVGAGAQAELAVVHERLAMRVPDGLGWPDAGGFPEVFLTAHDALFTRGQVSLGDRVLVHGAAGGVGTAGVQLAAAAGARVTASVRNRDAWDGVRQLGAAEVVAHDDFADRGPFDVVLELGVDQQHRRARMLDDVRDLVGLEPEVDRHHDAAEAADTEERHEETGGVGRHDRHPLAPPDTQPVEAGRLGPSALVDLAPCERAP